METLRADNFYTVIMASIRKRFRRQLVSHLIAPSSGLNSACDFSTLNFRVSFSLPFIVQVIHRAYSTIELVTCSLQTEWSSLSKCIQLFLA